MQGALSLLAMAGAFLLFTLRILGLTYARKLTKSP